MWTAAHLLSQNDLQSESLEQRIWAHTNLLELYLLSFQLSPKRNTPSSEQATAFALQHAYELLALAGRGDFSIYLTRRQIRRYCDWFPQVNLHLSREMIRLAEKIYGTLEENDQPVAVARSPRSA
jgi:hypothetical protein